MPSKLYSITSAVRPYITQTIKCYANEQVDEFTYILNNNSLLYNCSLGLFTPVDIVLLERINLYLHFRWRFVSPVRPNIHC